MVVKIDKMNGINCTSLPKTLHRTIKGDKTYMVQDDVIQMKVIDDKVYDYLANLGNLNKELVSMFIRNVGIEWLEATCFYKNEGHDNPFCVHWYRFHIKEFNTHFRPYLEIIE